MMAIQKVQHYYETIIHFRNPYFLAISAPGHIEAGNSGGNKFQLTPVF